MPTAVAGSASDIVLELEASVDLIIAQCEGDARAAVRALIVANHFLERDLERLRASVSTGYVRGRFGGLLSRGEALASGHSGER